MSIFQSDAADIYSWKPSPASSKNGQRVWLVSDHFEQIDPLISILSHDGLKTRLFTNKSAVINALDEELPEAFIIDVALNDGHGYEIVEYIRNLKNGDQPVMLMMSSRSDFFLKVESIRCGADGYFEKPINAEALSRRLRMLIAKQQHQGGRILCVEDEEFQAIYFKSLLEMAGYKVSICNDTKLFDRALTRFKPDLILMDLSLRNGSGYELIRYLRQDERYSLLPIIVLTGEDSERSRIGSINAGANDHILKSVTSNLLLATLKGHLDRARMLRQLVERDAQTRLLTYSAFSERADQFVNQIEQHTLTALVLFDVDDFKSINRRFNYSAGDRVMISIANILRRRLRRSDLIGRYRNDKFIAIIDELNKKECLEIVTRLLDEIAAINHQENDNSTFNVTCSAGISFLEKGMEWEDWRKMAERALLAAKQAGPNRVSTGSELATRREINMVSVGGGTGLSSLLSGLKIYVTDGRGYERHQGFALHELTAVVTVTDDGGSSGRLREEFHILPPGDIRNCMVALSEDEQLLAQLFQYRFSGEGDLQGHSFGNIFLTGLTGVTGDFVKAIKLSSDVLAIRGNIFPSTRTDAVLMAELYNGDIVRGETTIAKFGPHINKIWLSPEHCQPLDETLAAIKAADIITLGPGSLFTSVIPNLLVNGIPQAINDSQAIKVYILNIMTQPGETDGFGAIEHLEAIYKCAPELHIDYIVINSVPVAEELRQLYLTENAVQIGLIEAQQDTIICRDHEINVVACNLLDGSDKARHSPQKLARVLLDIYSQHKQEKS